MRMFGVLARIVLGFVAACIAAGVATVAFVVTPSDIASLAPEVQGERLASAGVLALLAATHSAIFALPFALIAIAIAEWQAVRSWIYYVLAGIAIALAGFGAEYLSEVGGQPTIVNDYAARAFLTVGFVGGLAYWLVAGRGAGGKDADEPVVAAPPSEEPETALDEHEPSPKSKGKLAGAAG